MKIFACNVELICKIERNQIQSKANNGKLITNLYLKLTRWKLRCFCFVDIFSMK